MFAGTLYDVLFLQWPRWREEWRIEEDKKANIRSQNTDDEPLILKKDIQESFPVPAGEKHNYLLTEFSSKWGMVNILLS